MEKRIFVYENSPQWNLLIEEGKLLITKGADEIYLIEELVGKDAEILYEAYKNEKIHEINANTENDNFLGVISKLEKAGVIYKKNEESAPLKPVNFFISWVGVPNQNIINLLEQFSKNSKQINFNATIDSLDILIVIRTSAKLAEVMKGYEKIRSPHLFVDIAYDHTLSLGPLVFPGDTACLGCFIGRITRNWGDAEPPKISNMSGSYELIASLILEQLRIFQKIGSCPDLIEKTWTFNVSDLTSRIDNIFRLPWCPICYPEKPREGLGSFELPWKMKDGQI